MKKKIAVTDLEYMVEPLPESMYNLIWNFDSLQEEDEKKYILKMVEIKDQLECQKMQKMLKTIGDKIFNVETLQRVADTVLMC